MKQGLLVEMIRVRQWELPAMLLSHHITAVAGANFHSICLEKITDNLPRAVEQIADWLSVQGIDVPPAVQRIRDFTPPGHALQDRIPI